MKMDRIVMIAIKYTAEITTNMIKNMIIFLQPVCKLW